MLKQWHVKSKGGLWGSSPEYKEGNNSESWAPLVISRDSGRAEEEGAGIGVGRKSSVVTTFHLMSSISPGSQEFQ